MIHPSSSRRLGCLHFSRISSVIVWLRNKAEQNDIEKNRLETSAIRSRIRLQGFVGIGNPRSKYFVPFEFYCKKIVFNAVIAHKGQPDQKDVNLKQGSRPDMKWTSRRIFPMPWTAARRDDVGTRSSQKRRQLCIGDCMFLIGRWINRCEWYASPYILRVQYIVMIQHYAVGTQSHPFVENDLSPLFAEDSGWDCQMS